MDVVQSHKPSHEEWLNVGHVVIERLTSCAHIYSKPPHEDVFMPDQERQTKIANTVDLLRRIHALLDEADTPTESLSEVAHHDQRVIAGLEVLMRETLSRLPELSTDMQKLLKSPWHSQCTGRLADELFRGPHGKESEGIGSGHPEHGRLPEVINGFLEKEQTGEIRRPREALQRETSYSDNEPQRNDESQRRWADKNSRLLRSAGRVE
jgi:hypothetical protein